MVVIFLLCKCSGEWFNNIGLDGLSVVGLRNWCRILRYESVCLCGCVCGVLSFGKRSFGGVRTTTELQR